MRNARASRSGLEFVIRHSGLIRFAPLRAPFGRLSRFARLVIPAAPSRFVLVFAEGSREITEPRRWAVPGLEVALGEVDAAAVEAAGGAGFEALHLEAELAEAVGQGGDAVAHAPAGLVLLADVEQAAHEGAGGNDDRFGPVDHAEGGAHAGDGVVFDEDLGGVALVEVEVGLVLDEPLHAELVGLLVALGTGGLDAGALAGVQKAELDTGSVGVPAHDPAEGVDLPHDVPFGQTADGGVAGHLRDGVEILGEDGRLAAHACGGHRGLDPGVTGSANDDVVVLREGIQRHGD